MKPGVGKHYPRGSDLPQVIRPGDTIECSRARLGGALWKFDQVEPEKEEEIAPPEIVARGGGWYDVIHGKTRRPINDKPLKKKEAEALLYAGDERDGGPEVASPAASGEGD